MVEYWLFYVQSNHGPEDNQSVQEVIEVTEEILICKTI